MERRYDVSTLIFIFMAMLFLQAESSMCSKSSTVHRKTYRSPPFSLEPGEVQNRFYEMEFPQGHLGIKNFMGEVVDELGTPVPLNEVYLHHWVVFQLYVNKSAERSAPGQRGKHRYIAGNDGICQNGSLSQFWGLGSETRHTNYSVPPPYAINVGDPSKVPDGYEELWELNVHAIDVRGTEDPLGCLECRCDLYNVTKDEFGAPLPAKYKGGLKCCYEGTRCKVKPGYEGPRRKLYLQYTIEWVEWDDCVQPVQAYIFDVTDTGDRDPVNSKVGCKIEYDVPACVGGDCVHEMETNLVIPKGGSLVYGVAHQHSGAQGMSLHGEDGRHVCSSFPSYGHGASAGDEAGYVVGMSTCYPEPGTTVLKSGEKLRFTSFYNSSQPHTGVMALFYVLVADDSLEALQTNESLSE